MDNKNEDSNDEFVTLVLGDNKIQANKQKLADYSLYFASLFSENFKDHVQNEFKINYDITLCTLNHFVNWVNNEDEHTKVVYSQKYFFFVRASLEKFTSGHFAELLELLELSVVFMAERLTEHITELIICMRFPVHKVIHIWLLAENLGLKVLRDVSLAILLDRFEELPASALLKLPVDSFLKLILNVNVRSSPQRLQEVKEEWRKHNEPPKDLSEPFLQFLNGDADYVKSVLSNPRKRFVQCVVGHKVNKSLGIWSWNGKSIEEMTEMTDAKMHTTFEDNGKDMVGRQITGRGFHTYLIGGEQGIGTGRFNTALWRYCPFSKKWYIVSLLPRPRRHMAVAFIGNKLYLFGGVGRYRCKLSSVDVYDVHTGLWSEAANIPEQFTVVPPACVDKTRFIYYEAFYLDYDSIADKWPHSAILGTWNMSMINTDEPEFDIEQEERTVEYLAGARSHPDDPDTSIVYRTMILPNSRKARTVEDFIDWRTGICSHNVIHSWSKSKDDPDGPIIDQQIVNWPYLVSFTYSEGQITVEMGRLRTGHKSCRDSDDDQTSVGQQQRRKSFYHRMKCCTKKLTDAAPNCLSDRLGCFNLIDPDSLHKIVPLPEQASISV